MEIDSLEYYLCTDYMHLNKRLALLSGWTELVEVSGSLLGKPPGGSSNSRDQAMVPDWVRNWSVCAPLIVKYNLSIIKINSNDKLRVSFNLGAFTRSYYQLSTMGTDPDTIMRSTIVMAVISLKRLMTETLNKLIIEDNDNAKIFT